MGVLLLAALFAHPHHVTVAEVEYEPKTRALEVALKVRPVDLERVLKRRAGKAVDIDSDAGETVVAAYFAERFTVTPPDATPDDDEEPDPLKFEWVGREFGVAEGWVYFKLPLGKRADGFEGLTVADRVLFDLEADQVNRVVFTVGRTRAGYTFDRDHPARVLRAVDLEPIDPPETSSD